MLLTFLLALLLSAPAASDDYKVILTLKDGTVMDGFIRTSLMGGVSKVGFSESPKGNHTVYEASLIESLVYPPSEDDTTTVKYVPVPVAATPTLWHRNPKAEKEPVLLREVYVGKNVSGYVAPCVDQTHSSDMIVYRNTYRYYYMINGEPYAKAYWFDASGIKVGTKAALKLVFDEDVMALFEDGTVKVSDFTASPGIMWPILDEVVENREK